MKKQGCIMMALACCTAFAGAQTFGPGLATPDAPARASGTATGNPAAAGARTTVPIAPMAPARNGTPTAPGGIAPATGAQAFGGNGAMPGQAGASAGAPGNGAMPAAPGTGMAAGATTGQGSHPAPPAAGSAARFDPSSVPGWSMMTPQEQQAYSDKMNGVTTLGQCRALNAATLAQMQNRARSVGQTLEARQAADPCTAMQKQGTLQR